MVRYERFLDYASLRVLLNGQDISEQFRVDSNNKIADDIVYLELPLQQGENMLHVSGYFSGDAQGASQKGCELPPSSLAAMVYSAGADQTWCYSRGATA